jgi:signal peptidase II
MKKKSYIVLAIVLIVIDQITKYLAFKFIGPFETIKVLPFFNLVYLRNTGSAFGMFSSLGNEIFIVISLIAIAVIVFMLWKDKEDSLGLSLILSGAIGNLLDRFLYGSVRDFIDIHAGSLHWPAFNIADSAITIGIAIIFIRIFRQPSCCK